MTSLEDRVRSALRDHAAPAPVEAFLADVHTGARRRRRRRTAGTTAAVAAAAALCVGVVTWWATPDHDKPEPAGIVPWDSPQVMAPVPVADGRLYGLAGTRFCDTGCESVLWVEDEDGHAAKVHAFPAEQSVYWVDLAPDVQHGFAFGRYDDADASTYRTLVWRTSDGGRTWDRVDEQLSGYQYPPDVEYLDGAAYLLTRPMGPTSYDEGPRLWRTPIDGEAWEEVSLTDDGVDFWFDMTAGLLAPAGRDGRTDRLAVVRRDSIMVSADGDEWERSVDLPCPSRGGQQPFFAGETPTTLFVWCPAPGEREVQLWRSVDLRPFEPLGGPMARGHMYPATYPTLVGPFPVETRSDGAYAVVRTGDSFWRLGLDGDATEVPASPLLGDIANLDPASTSHRPGRSYLLTPRGQVLTTDDPGSTWSPLGP